MPEIPPLNTNFVPDAAGAQQNALRTQGFGMQNQLAAEQIRGIPQQREMGMMELQLKRTALEIQKKALEKEDTGEPISIDYPEFSVKGPKSAIMEVADAVAKFPDKVKDPNFAPWVASKGVSYELKTDTTKPGWSAPKEGIDEEGNQVIYRINDAGEVEIIKGVRPKPTKGMKIYDREGNLMVDMGGGEGPEMSKKTQGAIEEKIVGGKEQLARMQTIATDFKPEYQEIGTRLKASWTGIQAKLGMNVDPESKKTLVEFKKFQRKAIENINLYIKELTGAQMSEKEADRLRLAQPDPGEKWYSGDDPITFKAKLDDVLKFTRAAVARYQYYRNKGLDDAQIKAIINDNSAVSLDDLASRMK